MSPPSTPLPDAALRCLDEVPPFDGETAREMIPKDLAALRRRSSATSRSRPCRPRRSVRCVHDLRTNPFKELNPALEAYRQDRFRQDISAFGDNEFITAPEVYWDYCGRTRSAWSG